MPGSRAGRDEATGWESWCYAFLVSVTNLSDLTCYFVVSIIACAKAIVRITGSVVSAVLV
ncbi:MAG: hypothetical protein BWY17_04810 [Deltaproteobacteria bacterium ADurb.Bin207]|nr:MAG: hypothetical protein BWY17_04810 [Deltaproteobacteria bacterium ADurb.Bin207]